MNRSILATLACLTLALSTANLAAARKPPRPAAQPASGVKIMASEADPNFLASFAAPDLQKAASDFAAHRKALPSAESGTGAATYGAEDLKRIVTAADTAVREALKERELSPLRDYAARAFRRAQQAFGPEPQVAKDVADKALEALGGFLDKVAALTAKGPVTVDLCVISKPEPGAKFSLQASGDPATVKVLPNTDGMITAVRGLYAYKLEHVEGHGKPVQCGWDGSSDACLDLFEDAQTPLICDFDAGSCTRAAGSCS